MKQCQVIALEKDAKTRSYRAMSGAMAMSRKRDILDKIQTLLDAVVMAREGANTTKVEQQHVAAPLFDYIFGD